MSRVGQSGPDIAIIKSVEPVVSTVYCPPCADPKLIEILPAAGGAIVQHDFAIGNLVHDPGRVH